VHSRLLVVAVGLAAGVSIAFFTPDVLNAVTRFDLTVSRALTRIRWQPLTDVLSTLSRALGSSVAIAVLGWGTLIALLLVRRLRHLIVYAALLLGVSVIASALATRVGRMRPAEVSQLIRWDGYAFPSRSVIGLGLVLAGVVFTLVPGGAWRRRALFLAFATLAVFAFARVYLGVDHLTDVLCGLAFGWALAVAVFRLTTPDESFPVRYRRGPTAHLDLTPARREAITRAVEQQLGLRVTAIERFGLGGSAGSTPLRVWLRGDGESGTFAFAKIYALNHLRSDRWYKFTRTILYGRLEDEKPFSSVRRLVEYEDHLLRLLRDAGLPTPRPLGFVEITPEREYLILMEYFEGAVEIGDAEVNERVIQSGLSVVRKLWDAGVAHRDIKPSNVLVRHDSVLLIDVAFATVRPTPWRQAVDLANMMLTLALGSTPQVVYEQATRIFAPDDIAEAFAATRGVTIPNQLRARLKEDGRDLAGAFRELAPARSPVRVQLWSPRRIAVTFAVVVALALASFGVLKYGELTGLL
jgi:tRNA A-37 threonylcarbamoyl transferase component Bud32/membrane-associated phospholipid phosphatase